MSKIKFHFIKGKSTVKFGIVWGANYYKERYFKIIMPFGVWGFTY